MTLLRGLRVLAARAAAGVALAALVALASPAAWAAGLRVATAFDPQTMDPHSLALQYHTRVVF